MPVRLAPAWHGRGRLTHTYHVQPCPGLWAYAEPTLLDRARQCEVRRMVCVYCDPAGAVADAKMRERYHAAGAAGAAEPSCGGSTEEHTTK